jgi:hypothetical protein
MYDTLVHFNKFWADDPMTHKVDNLHPYRQHTAKF